MTGSLHARHGRTRRLPQIGTIPALNISGGEIGASPPRKAAPRFSLWGLHGHVAGILAKFPPTRIPAIWPVHHQRTNAPRNHVGMRNLDDPHPTDGVLQPLQTPSSCGGILLLPPSDPAARPLSLLHGRSSQWRSRNHSNDCCRRLQTACPGRSIAYWYEDHACVVDARDSPHVPK